MDTKTLSLFATAALNLILAVIIYSKGGKNPVTRSYAAAVASVALWAFGHGMYSLPNRAPSLFWFYFTYVAGAFIASQFFLFSTVFPNRTSPPRLPPSAQLLSTGFPLLVVLGLLSPGFLVENLVETGQNREVEFVQPTYVLYTLGFSLLMGWGFLNLFNRYRKSPGRQKMQIRYVVAGTGIASIFGSYFNLWLPWWGNTDLMWLGPHFSLFMIACIAYAIVKHRLMDIRIILSRTIVYSLLLACTLVLYTMLILVAQRFFQDKTGYTTSLVIGSLLIALGFEPLKQLFQRATEKVFFKGELNPQRLLGELGETFSTIRDLDGLLETTCNQLSTAFRTDHTILLTLMDLEELTGAASGGHSVPPSLLKMDHPIVQYFSSRPPGEYLKMPPKKESLLQEELLEARQPTAMVDEDTRNELLSAMTLLQTAAIVPIFMKEQLTGIILMGNKRSGESFFPADISFLEIIAQQAGVAIENARLYRTLQRQMEELKRSQTLQLIQSAKLASIGELATNVAHEINNPLTSILGFASLMIEDMGDENPHKRDLRVIESEAMRSREIVRNLLDFARKRPTKRELTDVNVLIQKTLNLLRHQAELSNIMVKEEFASDLPTITVDADQMKQVFINLFKNAFDAMPKGGTLTISTFQTPTHSSPETSAFGRTAPPNRMIEIQFKDTGIGISKDHIKKIFDPFFTTKEEMGTGLGLAVSYGIIERHSGRMEVFSKDGEGATFIIKLPIKQEVHITS